MVAHLEKTRTGRIACRYADEVIDQLPGGVPVLSCSLPVSPRKLDATGWARGLLPEGQHLASLAAAAEVSVGDTYELLARYGRDVAGAFEIIAGDAEERRPSVESYTTETSQPNWPDSGTTRWECTTTPSSPSPGSRTRWWPSGLTRGGDVPGTASPPPTSSSSTIGSTGV